MAALIRALPLLLLAGSAGAQELLDRVVAVVDDDIVTARELEQRARIIEQQLSQARTAPPPRAELLAQVLDYMVAGRLQLRQAERRGLELPAAAVDRHLAELAARNRMSPQAFRREVERGGIRYRSFRGYIREQLLTQRLQQLESRRLVQVTEADIDHFLRLHEGLLHQDVRYRLRHILVEVPRQSGPQGVARARGRAERLRARALAGEPFAGLAVAESDGRNALSGGDLGWRTAAELPAVAAEAVPALAAGGTTAVLRSPSGFHLFHVDALEGGAQVTVRQTRARHILLRPNALIDDAEARARLDALRARVEAGESFADLARSHSDDTASAVDGGDLGWRSPGELEPAFEEQLERLAPDAVSAPFRTRFGWHLAQVAARRDVDETAQTLRQRALNHLARGRAGEAIELWLRRLRENAYIRILLHGGADA